MRSDGGETWTMVELATWSEFFMALRAVLLELPPGSELRLTPSDDDRVAHVASVPRPRVEIHAGQTRLASLPCDSLTDVIDHLESNVREHWELGTPSQLLYRFVGDVAPRLRTAFTGDEIIGDLPEGERPSATAYSQGDAGTGDLSGRVSPDVLEQLRKIGRDY